MADSDGRGAKQGHPRAADSLASRPSTHPSLRQPSSQAEADGHANANAAAREGGSQPTGPLGGTRLPPLLVADQQLRVAAGAGPQRGQQRRKELPPVHNVSADDVVPPPACAAETQQRSSVAPGQRLGHRRSLVHARGSTGVSALLKPPETHLWMRAGARVCKPGRG